MLPNFYDAFLKPAVKCPLDERTHSDMLDDFYAHSPRKLAIKRPFSKVWEKVKVLEMPDETDFHYSSQFRNAGAKFSSDETIETKRARRFYVGDHAMPMEVRESQPTTTYSCFTGMGRKCKPVYGENRQCFVVKEKEMTAFFRLLGNLLCKLSVFPFPTPTYPQYLILTPNFEAFTVERCHCFVFVNRP